MSLVLRSLGYSHKTGPYENGLIWHELGQLDRLWEIVDNFDTFDDFPYPYLYKEIDQRYPNAKFILTTRNTSREWLASLKKHSLRNGPNGANLLAYGCYSPEGYENRLLSLYDDHISDVSKYFSNRSDFIKINLSSPDAKTRLAHFLDVDPDRLNIPVANSSITKDPKKVIDRLIRHGYIAPAIHFAKTTEQTDQLLAYVRKKYERRQKLDISKRALPRPLLELAVSVRRRYMK
jgi:hypothetical protein